MDLGDAATFDDLFQGGDVGHIERFVSKVPVAALGLTIAGDHALVAIAYSQGGGEFRSQLTIGAYDQNSGVPFGIAVHDVIPYSASPPFERPSVGQTRPSSFPACAKAASAVSSCSWVCSAPTCTRMRAWPLGTTG